MKNLLIISILVITSQLQAVADCDLFKEEVAVINEQVQSLYKGMYETQAFVQTAKERKSVTDNEKLGRYLENAKKELELIEHGMSQLKLHGDCACEGFNFQFVDNTLIEIKYWLKKAQSIDLAKPKKTDYAGLDANVSKSLNKTTNLQVYFLSPCKEGAVASNTVILNESQPVPEVDSTEMEDVDDGVEVIAAGTTTTAGAVVAGAVIADDKDSSKVEEEDLNRVSEAEPTAPADPTVMDTVRHADVSTGTTVGAGIEEEETPAEETADNANNSNGTEGVDASADPSSVAGAVVIGTTATAGAVVAGAVIANDKDSAKVEEEKVEEIEPASTSTTVMDTVRHSDVSTGAVVGAGIVEEQPATEESANSQEGSGAAEGIDGSVDPGAVTGAVAAGTTVAAGAVVAGAVVSDDKDGSSVEEEPEKIVDNTVMDTVRHRDVSTAAPVAAGAVVAGAVVEADADSSEVEESEPKEEIANNTGSNSNAVEGVNDPSGAVAAGTTVAAGAVVAGAVIANDEDGSNVEEEPEKVVDNTIMDTVRHKDVSVMAPVEEEKPVEVVEAPAEPKVKAPKVAPVAAVTQPETKKNYVPNDFHYAVQIATGKISTSDSKYAPFGNDIYSVEESGMTKYRVGKYGSFNEAKATKNKAFNSGIIDAFIVVYNNGSRISFEEARNLENGNGNSGSSVTKAKTSSSKPAKTPKIRKNDNVFLAVQIGANVTSTDPMYELIKYERKINQEVHVLHGSPVRFYTGELKNAIEAEQLLKKVRMAGIQDAFLIGISNDKRIEYKAALEFLGQ
ncbi:MAG: hypothetical protein CL840_07940 [Crocinitomicaceae bacterium]|nr:hypothetical protein [Crocinitomicaceae bacterium]|tara:strand:+ start:2401 stop:4773 length:2373 start_codon:yes stop_codon:yes gene_type:complete